MQTTLLLFISSLVLSRENLFIVVSYRMVVKSSPTLVGYGMADHLISIIVGPLRHELEFFGWI